MWSHLDIKAPNLRPARNVVTTWLPVLWDRAQTFPVSLSLAANDRHLALRDGLSPYFRRLQSLSLDISMDPSGEFLSGPPIPFDHLDTLALAFRQNTPNCRVRFLPAHGPPIVTFTASPALRKVTLFAHSLEFIGIPALFLLPWSQLTHIAFHMSKISFMDFECILRQCNKLISLAFTSFTLDQIADPSFPASNLMIHLPHLRSLTLIAGESNCNFHILEQLQVPALTDFTIEHERYSQANWDQPRFMNMIDRSQCSLRALNLSSKLLRIPFDSLEKYRRSSNTWNFLPSQLFPSSSSWNTSTVS